MKECPDLERVKVLLFNGEDFNQVINFHLSVKRVIYKDKLYEDFSRLKYETL